MSARPIYMLVGALWLIGCGASGSQPAPLGPRNATEASAVEPARLGSYLLPPWPAAVQSSQDLREGLRLARAFFALLRSRPANDVDQAGYKAWLDGAFKTWMERHGQAIAAAEEQLDAVAAGTTAEQVVAATVIALMFEHFTTQFMAAPVPPDLRGDRELTQIFDNGLRTAAQPWVEKSVSAYGSCARAAATDASLEPWRALCLEHERAQRAWLASAAAAPRAPQPPRTQAAQAPDRGERPPGSDACWQVAEPGPLPRPQRAPSTNAPRVAAIVFHDEVPLLAQERRALAAALHTALQRHWQGARSTIEWLDDAVRDRMVAEWSHGQAAASGPRCARVPVVADTLAQRIPGLIAVHVGHACADGTLHGGHCELLVGVCCGDAVPRGIATDLKAPLVSDLTDLATWTHAASELQSVKPAGSIVGMLRADRWHPPMHIDLAFDQLVPHGPVTLAELDAQLTRASARSTVGQRA